MAVLDKYYRIGEVAGISINLLSDGGVAIHLCTVKASGNELSIDKKVTDINSINQLKPHLPEKSIIALNLNGKAILHKQIKHTDHITPDNFGQVIPNGKIDDFYVQHFKSGESSFVSLVRRTEADRWLNQLEALGFKPLMLSLGPFPVSAILPQLNVYEGDFTIDGNRVERDEQANWNAYHYEAGIRSSHPFKVADEKIDERLVIPYAAAFQLVMSSQLDTVHAEAGSLEAALQRKLSGIKFKVQGFIILIIFFVLLLANYGMLSWLSSSNTKLNEQAALYSENTNNLNELTAQIKEKKDRVLALGWEEGISKSELIDQVASLLPPEITLTDITVDPLDQVSSRVQRSLVFFSRKIQITGTAQQIIPVNEWIARIKTKRWVKNIQMDSYTFDSELNTARFLITINY